MSNFVVGLLIIFCFCSTTIQAASWSADGFEITNAHTVIRPGLLYRLDIRGTSIQEALSPPIHLTISLQNDVGVICEQQSWIHNTETWTTGISCALRIPTEINKTAIRLICIATESEHTGARRQLGYLEQGLESLSDIRSQAQDILDRYIDQTKDKKLSPSEQLQAESIALLLQAPPSLLNCRRLKTILQTNSQVNRAWVSPYDHGVLPYRLYKNKTGDHAGTIVYLSDTATDKTAWTNIPAAWLLQAQQHRFAVLTLYPAGDTRWCGHSATRLQAFLTQPPETLPKPFILIAQGKAAEGALQMVSQDPLRFQALVLNKPMFTQNNADSATIFGLSPESQHWLKQRKALAPKLERIQQLPLALIDPSPEANSIVSMLKRICHKQELPSPVTQIAPLHETDGWRWMHACLHTRQATSTAPLPVELVHQQLLENFANEPFLAIIGSGEHAAAREDNHRYALALHEAWHAHSHCRLPMIWDYDYNPRHHTQTHLILIGNSRSNRVLAQMNKDGLTLPVRWDDRLCSFGPDDQRQTIHRSKLSELSFVWPYQKKLLYIAEGIEPQFPKNGERPWQNRSQFYLRSKDGSIWQHLFDQEWHFTPADWE